MTDQAEARPLHVWNDPDGDGHNCADCASDSMWKCDEAAHFPRTAYGLLTPEEQAALAAALDEGARERRRGAASAGRISLP